MHYMNIGQAAAAAGVTAKMIRHYESLGLVPRAERTEGGYRLYSPEDVSMLRFIRQARTLGFSMAQIQALVTFWRDPSRRSSEVKQVALARLEELEALQRELNQMRASLEQLVDRCPGDQGAHCAILEGLEQAPSARPSPASPRSTLKRTRPGEKRTVRRKAAAPVDATPAHAALSAWTRSLFAPGPVQV